MNIQKINTYLKNLFNIADKQPATNNRQSRKQLDQIERDERADKKLQQLLTKGKSNE
jgi:hypothetical protein